MMTVADSSLTKPQHGMCEPSPVRFLRAELNVCYEAIMGSMGSQMLEGIRWLIVDTDHGAAAAIARELGLVGCRARMVDAVGLELAQLSAYDAHVVLVDESQDIRFLEERLELHAGLRDASVLRLPFSTLWQVGAQTPDLSILADKVRSLLERDRALRALSSGGETLFQTTTEGLGVVRSLRAIVAGSDVFRVTLRVGAAQAHIELAGHLVLGAWYETPGEPALMGEDALASAIELSTCEITVRRKVRPETPWLVLPLDEALERALALVRERRVMEHDDAPTLRIPSPFAPPQLEVASEEDDPIEDAPLARSVPTISMRAPAPSHTRWGFALVLMLLVGTGVVVQKVRRKHALERANAEQPRFPLLSAAAPRKAPSVNALERAEPAPALPIERTAGIVKLPPPSVASAPRTPDSNAAHELAARATQAIAERDWANAEKWAERAIELRPRKLQYRLLLADVFAASGRVEEARTAYEAALALRPTNRSIKQRLARLPAPDPAPAPAATEW